jgi:hypothetical protein
VTALVVALAAGCSSSGGAHDAAAGGSGGSGGGGSGGGSGGSPAADASGAPGGSADSGGPPALDGSRGTTDSGDTRDAGAAADAATPIAVTDGAAPAGRFSFFVTSLAAMRKLSKSQDGFGGDLRYGEATGLAGADKICREIAEMSLPGAGARTWRAFLSTVAGGPGGGPVNAIDRVGEGPWYDRLGRLVAANRGDLIQRRPRGADPAIVDDLPNETGVPNHIDGAPGCVARDCPDNHDTLTGTNERGTLMSPSLASTCNDWTNRERTGRPWCGHSWPRGAGDANWMSTLAEGGCAPGVNLEHMGGPNAPTVGSGGGYGGIYCFALTP